MTGILLQNNLKKILNNIEITCKEIKRNSKEITLIAVSKKQTISTISNAYSLGLNNFGENYLQEYLNKKKFLLELPITWHFIGNIQRKKIKLIVENFDYIHSIEKIETLNIINQFALNKNIIKKVLIQINLSGEKNKGGISPAEIHFLLQQINNLKNIDICGLMTMPPLANDNSNNYNKNIFKELRIIKDQLKANFPQFSLKHLSMGTSQDYIEAIKEGSTILRIGSALLGERNYEDKKH